MSRPEKYITISEFTSGLKNDIERRYPTVYLRGEISNFRPASSGHWYFSLKDNGATIKAIVFKFSQSAVTDSFVRCSSNPMPQNGMEVVVEGRISIYEKGGEYSVVISAMSPVGAGELAQKFELLKSKLKDEGLFDQSIKKTLPAYPSVVGIVTSPTAAALQDILNVLRRRHAGIRVIVYPSAVQGVSASEEIVRAIRACDYHYNSDDPAKPDLLIIARGGGSIEDLWCFNEESVARAIYEASVPIITGIGHEIDFTIADFCADLRAPTPSAAAEIISSSQADILSSFRGLSGRLNFVMESIINRRGALLDNFNIQRLSRSLSGKMEAYSMSLDRYNEKIMSQQQRFLSKFIERYSLAASKIQSYSPLSTLARGYAVVQDSAGNVVRDSSRLSEGDSLKITLEKGIVRALVN